jgi:TRAP-type uncharacterized transport system substrate-binding protein
LSAGSCSAIAPEALRQFADRKLDAVIARTGASDPAYQDLCRRSSIRPLSLDHELISKFVAQHAADERVTIPAGSNCGCDAAARTAMALTVMVAMADRSDAEVYDVARAIFENRQELGGAWLRCAYPGALFDGIDISLHPAAERFWTTQGLLARKKAR